MSHIILLFVYRREVLRFTEEKTKNNIYTRKTVLGVCHININVLSRSDRFATCNTSYAEDGGMGFDARLSLVRGLELCKRRGPRIYCNARGTRSWHNNNNNKLHSLCTYLRLVSAPMIVLLLRCMLYIIRIRSRIAFVRIVRTVVHAYNYYLHNVYYNSQVRGFFVSSNALALVII